MTQYHTIVSLKYNNAAPVVALIRAGKYKQAVEHLKSWDYGAENEHSPYDAPPWGTYDKTYKTGRYTLAWNFALDDTVTLYRSERVRKQCENALDIG